MSSIRLEGSVQRIPGVGPARARRFAEAGIETVEDLLLYLPFRYEDRSSVIEIGAVQPGETCVLRVEVVRCRLARRGRRGRAEARVRDASGELDVVWFGQPYIANSIAAGDPLWMFGRVGSYEDAPHLVNPVIERDEAGVDGTADAGLHVGGLVPIYRRVGKLTPGVLRRIVTAAFVGLESAKEHLPAPTVERLGLIDRDTALQQVHQPPADADPEIWNGARSDAHRRLICDEFLAFQTALLMQRRRIEGGARGISFGVDSATLQEVLAPLPFTLTAGQERALNEIIADMSGAAPMHRLLQGDVGCGKTAVAGAALMLAARNGYQATIMAPTEILARQHVENLGAWASQLGICVECLVGGQGSRERARVMDAVRSGSATIVVGTHALIEPAVEFHRLGLVVVDEQHRFGVRQRAALARKGGPGPAPPDLLVMSATPIPRSLALTAYGDLDLCTIDDMPPGRRPVETRVVAAEKWGDVLQVVRRTVDRGEQVYVVAPRIEDAEDETGAAVLLEADLQRQLPRARIGLLHGAQTTGDKAAAMGAFVVGDTDVLAATTVVEVGVDVPNASLMVVGHAERFGLAQLHQLRGRVGRGTRRGQCILIAHQPLSSVAGARLSAVRDSHDGFVLAEKDLALRGPGEVLGTRQAGVAGLRVGDPVRDHEWLEAARQESARLVVAEDTASIAYRKHVSWFWERRFVNFRAG